ncbi:unnamed protein product, partial [Ectocarpus sp. 12 AP-2014]
MYPHNCTTHLHHASSPFRGATLHPRCRPKKNTQENLVGSVRALADDMFRIKIIIGPCHSYIILLQLPVNSKKTKTISKFSWRYIFCVHINISPLQVLKHLRIHACAAATTTAPFFWAARQDALLSPA